jgi:ABC-type bacteriocin/lantibiotic exporter with double-glycine peptidase domain
MGLSGYFQLSAGDFLQFTMFMVFMIAPIVQMSNIGSQLTEAFAGLDRTEELMNMPVEDDGTHRTLQIGNIKGDFEFNDVSFAYEEGKPVLKKHFILRPRRKCYRISGYIGFGQNYYCRIGCHLS